MTSVFEIAAMAIAYVAMFGIKHTTRAAVFNRNLLSSACPSLNCYLMRLRITLKRSIWQQEDILSRRYHSCTFPAILRSHLRLHHQAIGVHLQLYPYPRF